MRRYWASAAIAAGLALCATIELLAGPDGAPPAAMPTAPLVASSPASLKLFTPHWATIILARPLFQPDRRPIVIAAAPVDDTLPRLSAIVITATGRSAIFIAADGAAVVISSGGQIGVYQVRHIGPDSVSLSGPTGAVTVHPQYPSAGAASAPAVQPAPPSQQRRPSNAPA